MHTGRCDCCQTATGPSGLDVLRAVGWVLIEHSADERLVLLCPVCAWQRSRAVEAVSEAVEAAYGAREVRGAGGESRRRRVAWFWS